MLHREVIVVCSQIHTEHINTLCGQNVEFVRVKLAVRIVTAGLSGVKTLLFNLKCLASEALCWSTDKFCSYIITSNRNFHIPQRDRQKVQYRCT